MKDGILNINKPQGVTSHDVVRDIRRLLGTKKIGHTGTLDPLASGVLTICVGPAARLDAYLVDHDKSYLMDIVFGYSTTTDDAEGETLDEAQPEKQLFDARFAKDTIEGLVDLNICHNYIEDPTPLYNCKNLERLWISCNRIKRDKWPEIAEALPNCECIFDLWWSTGAGWREHERYFWMHSFFYPELYPELVTPSASPVPEG